MYSSSFETNTPLGIPKEFRERNFNSDSFSSFFRVVANLVVSWRDSPTGTDYMIWKGEFLAKTVGDMTSPNPKVACGRYATSVPEATGYSPTVEAELDWLCVCSPSDKESVSTFFFFQKHLGGLHKIAALAQNCCVPSKSLT